MPELDDAALEARLRGVLKERLGALPLDLTVEALDRRREAKGDARRFGRGRGITLLAAAALLLVGGAFAAGSGILRLPTVIPPVPSPSVVAVATTSPDETSPSPSASASPSPTTLSLDLTWTQLPLDEQSPRLAWIGDRFVPHWDAWVTKKLGLRTNNDWTCCVKSVTFRNGVLQIKLTNRPGLKVVWATRASSRAIARTGASAGTAPMASTGR